MQLSIAIIAASLLSTTTLASPACGSALKARADQSANTALVLSVNGTALAPDISLNCILNCGEILLESACIATAIALKDPGLVLDCIHANNWSDVCGCINCIPGLSTFLHNHGICK